MSAAVETRDLSKSYGEVKALDSVSLTIPEGDFFGLLGPNGAGKTTLIRILTTLIRPTSGSARVMGKDVVHEPSAVRGETGVVPQAMTSDLDLTGYETMDIYARFYGIPKAERKERADELLSMVGLRERAGDLVATYSGGMRRRLEIARGLVHRPSILILDEPTIGLDPQSRHVVWELLNAFRKADRLTILLTTHYMEEAETLCDHVAIIDYGKIVALDTVPGLKQAIPQKDRVELAVTGVDMEKAAERVKAIPGAASADYSGESIILSSDKGAEIIPEAVDALKAMGGRVSRVTLKEQTLEDVFIHYTGRPIREEEAKKVSILLGAGIPSKWGR
ncbi:MAG: ATP-binding cassette domain-containing protein [Deltaproteobacteria bacterium]|nr:ATP-binding cassette domain-containing protein [Deltaproteobacteria bacterium]MBZ0219312.1 ATP-binding cassette domain-containing protein [Deltaproteobacteria bacterium]